MQPGQGTAKARIKHGISIENLHLLDDGWRQEFVSGNINGISGAKYDVVNERNAAVIQFQLHL
jgi:hypothetical protein